MADFPADLQSFRPSFPFLDIDPNMEPTTQFTEVNQAILDNINNPTFNSHDSSFIPFTNDNFFSHQTPEFAGNLAESFPAIFHQSQSHIQNNATSAVSHHQPITTTTGSETELPLDSKKRKAIMDVSESSSMNSSPQVSDNGTKTRNSSRRGKRVKSNQEEEKPKEVVHVRARRGQATDSHSLAERVRRGKINDRLRCLQDIVPGCYKTMGMAVMLDEIINYVQSLQNQVEFLSMKLTAASTFYDFNAETDAIERMQRAKVQEAKESQQRSMREGSGAYLHSTWPF